MNNIESALKIAQQQLEATQAEAELEAEILLCHLLHKNRAYLYAHPEELLRPELLSQYQKLIQQRVQGIPVAYLTGSREFWSLSLKVNAHTLIPRHETERLIELALELIPNQPDTHVLDLGTGSGAIALAIAKERPKWNIVACDSSLEALKIAEENAEILQISNVSFYHSNWFEGLPQRPYQAILSNPPYIPEQDPHLKQGDLPFEPLSALSSGQEGLADLQCIINQSVKHLVPGGLLLLEHGYDQKFSIEAILSGLGYERIQCWQDIQGQDRVSGGWLP